MYVFEPRKLYLQGEITNQRTREVKALKTQIHFLRWKQGCTKIGKITKSTINAQVSSGCLTAFVKDDPSAAAGTHVTTVQPSGLLASLTSPAFCFRGTYQQPEWMETRQHVSKLQLV